MEGPATSSGALPPDTNDADDLTMEPSDDLGLGPEVPGGTEHPLEQDYDVSNDAQLLRQVSRGTPRLARSRRAHEVSTLPLPPVSVFVFASQLADLSFLLSLSKRPGSTRVSLPRC